MLPEVLYHEALNFRSFWPSAFEITATQHLLSYLNRTQCLSSWRNLPAVLVSLTVLQKEVFKKTKRKNESLLKAFDIEGTLLKIFEFFDMVPYLYKQQVFFQIYLACIKCMPNFSITAIKSTWQTK